MYLHFCKFFVFVFIAISTFSEAWAHPECQTLPTAKNIVPPKGSYRLAVNPTMRAGIQSGTWQPGKCKLVETHWQIVENKSNFERLNFKQGKILDLKELARREEAVKNFTTFDVITDADKSFEILLPISLKPGKEYWWRASFGYRPDAHPEEDAHLHAFSSWTSFSEPTSFTTNYVSNDKCIAMPAPFVASPHSGSYLAANSALKVMDATSRGLGVDKPCSLANVEWQISKSLKFTAANIVFGDRTERSERDGIHHRTKVPAKALQGSSDFWWRARVSGSQTPNSNKKVYSQWTPAAHFKVPFAQPLTARTCSGLNAVVAINPRKGAIVSSTPSLEVATRGLSPGCKWNQTAWQVLNAANGDYVYQTGFIPQTNEIKVPSGKLKSNTTYIWRVKTKGLGVGPNGSDVFSDWSEESHFTVR